MMVADFRRIFAAFAASQQAKSPRNKRLPHQLRTLRMVGMRPAYDSGRRTLKGCGSWFKTKMLSRRKQLCAFPRSSAPP